MAAEKGLTVFFGYSRFLDCLRLHPFERKLKRKSLNHHVSVSLGFTFNFSLSLSWSCGMSESAGLELGFEFELEFESEVHVIGILLYVIAQRASEGRSPRSLRTPSCPWNASLPSRHGGGSFSFF